VNILQKIVFSIKNPKIALSIIMEKVDFGKEFSGLSSARSDSDNGRYIKAVESASESFRIFLKFKRLPAYRAILEHVSEEQGRDYLAIVNEQSPNLLEPQLLQKCKENDLLGNPLLFNYPGIGAISPTTLRYIKVASDLKKYFKDIADFEIAEIGCGYGGQLLILDKIFSPKHYYLFDLPSVLKFIYKYIENFILNTSYTPTSLNQWEAKSLDLVISNYAFSELPASLQKMYIKKVLSKAHRGYLTMNSGGSDHTKRGGNKLSIKELEKLLPPFSIIEEKPLTGADNYIIVWGHVD
jgi:putative sugar O-methyltransferase